MILDVGTGGGFPGIPLAIAFPNVRFHLVDSIGKKIKVVQEVAKELALSNIEAFHARAETMSGQYDFVVSRAVTQMEQFVPWVKGQFKPQSVNAISNGIIYLKGGDLTQELQLYPSAVVEPLSQWYDADFFMTKSIVYLPMF
ncbi:unnamed protein product [Notodromas monacha]|uniref:Uncharacterized protein n=1 Tax=Notodromas monacha TaxID=399045 RepID=A0A7R9C419_9CRUS|nr:unnamed protein product [Notodromas monacha]CAG0925762.1 unnamed protein product [Notodromas monacha]